PGILNGVAALTASSVPVLQDAMTEDVSALIAAVAPVSGSGQPILICAPQQQAALLLRTNGNPSWLTFASTALVPGTLIAVVPQAIATSVGAPSIRAGEHAMLHFEDASPSDIAVVGTPNVVAAPSKSMWQVDSIALRLELPCTWAKRSVDSV